MTKIINYVLILINYKKNDTIFKLWCHLSFNYEIPTTSKSKISFCPDKGWLASILT